MTMKKEAEETLQGKEGTIRRRYIIHISVEDAIPLRARPLQPSSTTKGANFISNRDERKGSLCYYAFRSV
jgi:hypothetical protein